MNLSARVRKLASAIATALTLVVVTACTPATTTKAEVQAHSTTRASVFDLTVPSASLGQQKVRVAIPPGPAPAGGWPVLYLLHGSSSRADGNRLVWASQFPNVFALAARDGVMLVMPEGGKAGYYSDWKSGPAWEKFHVGELPAFLNSHLPVNLSRQAIAGYSMGGFGALSYAARHPGRYRAVVALSPVAEPLRNPSIVLNDLRAASAGKYNLWGNPKTKAGKAEWKRHGPYYLATGLANTHLYLYAGKSGGSMENALRAQTIKLANRLKKLGLTKLHITLRLRTGSHGTHNYTYWRPRLDAAWPELAAALKR